MAGSKSDIIFRPPRCSLIGHAVLAPHRIIVNNNDVGENGTWEARHRNGVTATPTAGVVKVVKVRVVRVGKL